MTRKSHFFLSSATLSLLLCSSTHAIDYTVTLGTDSNTSGGGSSTGSNQGDLRYVLNRILNDQAQRMTAISNTITFSVPQVTLSAIPPMVNLFQPDTITIGNAAGSPVIIDGNNQYRAFFIPQGTVTLQNLTIQNAVAKGGNGGTGGGGGMGAGGGLFVGNDGTFPFLQPTVTLQNVSFSNTLAQGGNGSTRGVADSGGGR